MNIEAECEKCGKLVLLTNSYNGQPIICLDCNSKESEGEPEK